MQLLLQCRLDLFMLTAHTLSTEQRSVITSMVFQTLLKAEQPAQGLDRLLQSASLAFLLSLLQYLLLQAQQPPPIELVKRIDSLLKVS